MLAARGIGWPVSVLMFALLMALPAEAARNPYRNCRLGKANAIDVSVQATRNSVREIDQDVQSIGIDYSHCTLNDNLVLKVGGAFDQASVLGRRSTAARLTGGLTYWLTPVPSREDAQGEPYLTDVFFQVSGAVGYEDYYVPNWTIAVVSLPTTPGDPPVVISPSVLFYEKGQRTSSYFEALGQYSISGNTVEGTFPGKDARLTLEGRLAYVDKRTPSAYAASFGFNEAFPLGSVAVAYDFPVDVKSLHSRVQVRLGHEAYFDEALLVDRASTVRVQIRPQTVVDGVDTDLFAVGLRYTSGNAGFRGIALEVSKRF